MEYQKCISTSIQVKRRKPAEAFWFLSGPLDTPKSDAF